jgi:hypothetical protein
LTNKGVAVFKSFLGVYPVEDLQSITRGQWIDYLACIIKVNSVDGFSQKEKESLAYYIQQLGLSPDALDEAAEAAKQPFDRLLPSETLRTVLGPYIVRDALHVSHSDGISSAEKEAVLAIADQLGLPREKTDAVINSIHLYHEAVDSWKKAIA